MIENIDGTPKSLQPTACLGIDPDLFIESPEAVLARDISIEDPAEVGLFPGRELFNLIEAQREAKAKAICERCSTRQSCLANALENNESGVWGGTNDEERETIIKMRKLETSRAAHPSQASLGSATIIAVNFTQPRFPKL